MKNTYFQGALQKSPFISPTRVQNIRLGPFVCDMRVKGFLRFPFFYRLDKKCSFVICQSSDSSHKNSSNPSYPARCAGHHRFYSFKQIGFLPCGTRKNKGFVFLSKINYRMHTHHFVSDKWSKKVQSNKNFAQKM